MTATERARRSDSLYYGRVTRRELCDMVASREAEAGRLRREVERLRRVVHKGEGISDSQG